MKVFKIVFKFYLESSIHVSFAVLAFTLATYFEYNLPIEKQLLGFIFFGSITGYNFIKYAGIAGLHHRSLATNLKIIQLFSLLSFGFFLFFLFQVSKPVIITSSILGLLTLFYVVPFFNKKNLRSFNGLKIFIVAIVWAGVTVLLPWIHSHSSFQVDIWITFFQRLLWVLVLIIPFEIRDMIYDSLKLGTLPQKIGIKRTKNLGYFFLVLMTILEGFKDEITPVFSISYIVMIIVTGTLVVMSKRNQSGYYAAFWVEAIPIFWIGMLLMLKNYLFIS